MWDAMGSTSGGSMPPMPVISRSIITTSGCSSRLSATACRPSAASPDYIEASCSHAAVRPSR
jgi:hypothetical protein